MQRWGQARRFRHRGLAFALVALTVLGGVAWRASWFLSCPDVERLNAYRPGGAVTLFDRHGRWIADLTPIEHEIVALRSLPPYVGEAFIAIEDQRFRAHHGLDLPRVAGALWANLRAGKIDEGSSTITMQLARNVFPDRLPYRERTLARKLLEARVAQKIEKQFSKDQILEMYVNHIYFGSGAYGIEAAAHQYFGVSARELTLAQAATLAALPRSPGRYDPRQHSREAKERRDLVLSLMVEQKRVSPQQASQALREPIEVAAPAAPLTTPAPYFVEEVRKELERVLGDELYERPLRVVTTLDLDAQAAAEESLEQQLEAVEAGKLGKFSGPEMADTAPGRNEDRTPYVQGAFVAVEAATGDVLAWVGGRSFADSRFDRVRRSSRQAGSAFKPFVYATALEAGYNLTRPLSDEPLRVPLDRRRTWEPRNYDGAYEGSVTMREALVRSKNVPTVRLASELGYGNVAELARRAGLTSPISEAPSMALGTVSVSPLELTLAYTAFANLGSTVKPRVVARVEGLDGGLVWSAPAAQLTPVIGSATAYLITDVLHEALESGTGAGARAAGFSAPAAGKTGTTNDGADAWFVGYTPDVTATVWIGFDEVRPILGRATGGRLAAPVWGRVMKRLYHERPIPRPWVPPADVASMAIDPATGFPLSFDCVAGDAETRRELFRRDTMPTPACLFAEAGGDAPPGALQTAVWGDEEAPDAGAAGAVEPAHSYVPTVARSQGTGEAPGPGER